MIKYIGKCVLIEEREEKVLVIGDLHVGYESGLGIGGVDLSEKSYDEMINEFDVVFGKIDEINNKREYENAKKIKSNKKLIGIYDEYGENNEIEKNGGKKRIVNKIVLLGDLKHEFSQLMDDERNKLARIFNYFLEKCEEIIIIRGNHDNYLLNLTSKKGIKIYDYFIWKEYCFLHGDRDFPEIYDKKIGYWMMGHLHPAIKLREGTKVEKYKCFLEGSYRGKRVIIAPSFAEISEGVDIREIRSRGNLAWKFNFSNWNVKIVSGLNVLDFGKMKKLK